MPLRSLGMSISALGGARGVFGFCALRRQPLQLPGPIAAPAITQTIVQAMLALLPEFDLVGTDKITSPMFWTRRRGAGIPGLHFRKLLFKYGARRDYGALRRSHCAQPAFRRTRREI